MLLIMNYFGCEVVFLFFLVVRIDINLGLSGRGSNFGYYLKF